MIAVITIHISGNYADAVTTEYWLGGAYTEHVLITSMVRMMSSFAVPVFVMLSGVFALGNQNNKDCKAYYKKEFRNIGVPTLVFSILYFLYGNLRDIATGLISNNTTIEIYAGGISGRIRDLITGKAFYHLWYVYMIAGVFLLAPLIIRIKDEVGEKRFEKIAIVFFVISTLGLYTSTHELMWDPGHSFDFLGYFMMGYVISRNSKEKNGWKAAVLILSGLLILAAAACFIYFDCANQAGYEGYDELLGGLVGAGSPPVAAASVLIFAGFSKLEVRWNVSKLAKLSFSMYLLHAGVWDILSIFITKEMDSRIVIPAMVLLVFFLSWVAAFAWNRIWDKTEDKLHISEKLCKVIGLNLS